MDTNKIQYALVRIAKAYRKSYDRRLYHFVCACDLLPERIPKKKDVIVIVNTDTSDRPGMHWQAIWFTTLRRKSRGIRVSYFFDSYGQPPHNNYIRDFIKNNSQETSWNNRGVQSLHSLTCGEYCCLFALTMAKGRDFQCFFNQFGSDTDSNDEHVHTLYSCNLTKKKSSRRKQFCLQRCKSFNECINSNSKKIQ